MPQRVIDLTDGVAMVVTDLHGEWDAYERYRRRFLQLKSQGAVDRLIFCGDIIHGIGPANTDRSLDMLLDIIQLQKTFGADTVVMLLGNHELPHLYGLTLSRGSVDYTPRFEKALAIAGETVRAQVMTFIDRLPFYIRTAAGVMIAHCGASPMAALPVNRDALLGFDHQDFIRRVDAHIAQVGRETLRLEYEKQRGVPYQEDVQYRLAVNSTDDPRYDHLLRGLVLNRSNQEFELLWDAFFTRNENGMDANYYGNVVRQFLSIWSDGAPVPQQVLVSGHIPVLGGHLIVNARQLRIASWAHAQPHEAGVYLRLDLSRPVQSAEELILHLESVFTG